MRAISQDLQPLTSVAIAVLDTAGVLLEANAGFMRVLGKGPGRHIGANVAAFFSLPGFAEIVASQPFPNGDVYRGSMRLRDGSAEGAQFRGRVWRSAFGLCVQAEADAGVPAVEPRVAETQARRGAQGETKRNDPSSTDPVTGTGNRAWLDQAVAREIKGVQDGGFPFCVYLVRLDGLDAIVAQHGPAGRDKVLARFGFLLALLTRPSDAVARSDATEFAVLLPNTNIAQATSAAGRIGKVLMTDIPEPLGEPAFASFGVAEFRLGEDAGTLLSRARAALQC